MKLRGMVVASAALGLLASGGLALADSHGGGHSGEGKVKCTGINSCHGKGACSAADGSHGCAGQNSCEGKGWVYTASSDECKDQGGTALE